MNHQGSSDREQGSQGAQDYDVTPVLDHRLRIKILVSGTKNCEGIAITSNMFKEKQTTISSRDTLRALNEIVLLSGSFTKLISLDVYINEVYLTRLEANGIIISTPTGSTAYNMSSGGCMVSPAVDCMCITPMNSMSLSFRPLVLPVNTKIRIEV